MKITPAKTSLTSLTNVLDLHSGPTTITGKETENTDKIDKFEG